MFRTSKSVKRIAGLAAGLATPPGKAEANPLAWVGDLSIEQWLQFGALGLTALGLVLGFILLWKGKRADGCAFLLVVLVAGFTFLYAQVVSVKPGVDLVIMPTQFEPADAVPILVHNDKDLTLGSGRHSFTCNDRVLLTLNLEKLAHALTKARATSLVAASMSSVANGPSVGFDDDAGGAQ